MNSEAGDIGVAEEQLLDYVPFLFEKVGVFSLILTGCIFHDMANWHAPLYARSFVVFSFGGKSDLSFMLCVFRHSLPSSTRI